MLEIVSPDLTCLHCSFVIQTCEFQGHRLTSTFPVTTPGLFVPFAKRLESNAVMTGVTLRRLIMRAWPSSIDSLCSNPWFDRFQLPCLGSRRHLRFNQGHQRLLQLSLTLSIKPRTAYPLETQPCGASISMQIVPWVQIGSYNGPFSRRLSLIFTDFHFSTSTV